jgi:uncharacterized membrane protein HdeD (DUF308 family)
MQQFKNLYLSISWLLFISQVLVLFAWAYIKVHIGRDLYYGNPMDPNPGYENYFRILEALLYSTFVLVIAWSILTPFAVISNKGLENSRINILLGTVGFILAIGLLIIDPFGMFKWFTS